MTTTEQAIADLTTQAGLLLDLPQNIADAANGRINAIASKFEATVAALKWTAYVDPVNGSDVAGTTGTSAAPFRTVKRAVDLTPAGGMVTVVLVRNTHIDTEIDCESKSVIIKADGDVRHELTFERLPALSGNYRRLAAFLAGNGLVAFRGITIVIPTTEGSDYVLQNPAPNAAVVQNVLAHVNALAVAINLCNVRRPANAFGTLIGRRGGGGLVDLSVTSVTATDQALAGGYLHSVPAATDPLTLPWIRTDLTSL